MSYKAIKSFSVGTARGASYFEVGDEVSWPIGQLEQWEAMGLVAPEGRAPARPEPEPVREDQAEEPKPADAKRKRARK